MDAINQAALAPAAGHNNPPVDDLLNETRKLLRAHSRHSKRAIENLRRFLKGVMKTCEYARQSPENEKALKLALFEAGTEPPDEGNWFRTVISASYETKKERDAEKTNITKWASALCYAERQGKTSDDLIAWFEGKSIAALAQLEAAERRKGKASGNRSTKTDAAFEAVIAKHRKSIKLPNGIELADGDRFTVLVIERTEDGTCQVAQATPSIKEIRRYFADELPRRGRPRGSTGERKA